MAQIPSFLCRFARSPSKKLFIKLKEKNNAVRSISTFHYLLGKVSFKLADIGEGIREVVVKEWFVNVGDKVSQFDNICEVQSDKASVTITSRYDGIITKLHYKIDETALVGQPLVDLETDNQDDSDNQPEEQGETTKSTLPPEISNNSPGLEDEDFTSSKPAVLCIPSVRRLAKDHNIDLTKIKGTGKDGRILKEDISRYLEGTTEARSEILQAKDDEIVNDVIPIKGFTKAMFKTMTEALKIPHFVYSDEIKVTNISKLRKELKNLPELHKIKLTFLPFFIKATSNALRRYPIINSSIDEKCENILLHRDHNIGIAMDTEQGLAVPVIKNVENKTILNIAEELNKLIENGKNGTFAPSDLSGATFSISNIGIIGGTYTKPVILPPQVAIIAIGKAQILPRFDPAGNVIPEEIINISGSADHRVIDGVSMANFITSLKKQIENPNLLFLNL